jgi:8-oxo-dGTP diphosphatase
VTDRGPDAAVAVDLAVLTVRDDALQILMIERGTEPFLGRLALPGGFVERNESLDAAAGRELREETGLRPGQLHLEQLRAYGEPDRDPRMRIVSVCFLALMPDLPLPTAGGDARAARWMPVDDVLGGERPLAFDHRRIIGDAVERARGLLEYSTLGAAFCADRFAISDLRRIYEIVWGQRLDPGNFSRKVTGVEGFLVPTGEHSRDGGRPAALYRRGPATTLHPPLLRAGH